MTTARPAVVILGGGFAGLRALYRLHDLGERSEVVLVDARTTSLARPALPKMALAGKPVDHARFLVADVCARRKLIRPGQAASPRPARGSPTRQPAETRSPNAGATLALLPPVVPTIGVATQGTRTTTCDRVRSGQAGS